MRAAIANVAGISAYALGQGRRRIEAALPICAKRGAIAAN
jgi:hypothetical protein